MRYFVWLVVLSLAWAALPIACAGKPPVGDQEAITEIPVSPEVEAKYQAAENFYQDKKYKKAYKISKKALSKAKNLGQREQLMFLMAESLFQRKKYEPAYKAYEKLVAAHPQTERLNTVIDREYTVGFAFVHGRNRTLFGLPILPASEYGMDIVRKTIEKYPYLAASEKNHMGLADYLFKQGRYEDARAEYETFIGRYAQSAFLPKAYFMTGRCYFKEYQGPQYDIAPLLAAKRETQRLIEQYPDDSLMPEAQKQMEMIISQEAERDYEVGCFYWKIGKPEAACKYFQLVLANYPETKWAKHAEDMLKQKGVPGQVD